MIAQQFANLDQRELILFDLDGTLIDSAKDLHHAMNIALSDMKRPFVSEQQIRTWIGKGASQLCYDVLFYQDQVVQAEQHQQLLQHFIKIYEQNICVNTTLYEGALDFIQHYYLQKKMAIVTNKPYQATLNVLDALKLTNYFDLIIGGDSLAQRKPSAEPLLYAMQYFHQIPQKTLMIGDSENDIVAARHAQIDCIVLSYGYNHGLPIQTCNPQCVIDNLKQLM